VWGKEDLRKHRHCRSGKVKGKKVWFSILTLRAEQFEERRKLSGIRGTKSAGLEKARKRGREEPIMAVENGEAVAWGKMALQGSRDDDPGQDTPGPEPEGFCVESLGEIG